MTIQQANQYFAALPDGFADPEQLGALLPASVQQVQFVGVAGTAGKTAVARLLTAILQAQGIRAGVYHVGCEPLAARIRAARASAARHSSTSSTGSPATRIRAARGSHPT